MNALFSPHGPRGADDQSIIDAVDKLAGRSIEPFADPALDVVTRLSARLVGVREHPQFAALGYWLRPSAVKRLAVMFRSSVPENQFPVPRGLAFHLPPGNVDTIFVYSWALSLLAGNANVVRLPSVRPAHLEWLLGTLLEVLSDSGDADRHVFCSYGRDTSLNREISLRSDLRVIWGGDAKVREVSVDPMRPDGLSLGFPDRKSLAVIDSKAYARLEPLARDSLSEKLFNDVYWFDQMGCGSPRVLAWIGNRDEVEVLSRDMYTRLASIVVRKGYQVELGVAMSKISFLNDMLAEGKGTAAFFLSNELGVINLDESQLEPPERVVGGGMLSNVFLPALENLFPLVSRSTQTVSYFGFDESQLRTFIRGLSGKGGFRVVPIGQALSFDTTWDGISLLDHMTRRVVLVRP